MKFETIYLTTEQVQRIAALSLDALVGVQIHTNANDQTVALVDMVPIGMEKPSQHFAVEPDGTWSETT